MSSESIDLDDILDAGPIRESATGPIPDNSAGPSEPEITYYPEPEGGWRGGDVVKESKKGRWCFAGRHPDGTLKFQFKVTPHFGTPEGRKDINLSGKNGFEEGKKPIYLIIRERTEDGLKLVQFALDVMLGQGDFSRASIRDRLTAHAWLSERGLGKVKDTVVHENPDGTPLQPSQTVNILPPPDIYARLARVARALEAADHAGGPGSLPGSVERADPALPPHPDGSSS